MALGLGHVEPTFVEAADIAEERVAVLSELADKLPRVRASDLYRAATAFLEYSKDAAESYRAEYESHPREHAHILPLRTAGMMWRFVRELRVTDRADSILGQVEAHLDELITTWSHDYVRRYNLKPMRMADTVGYQLKVTLAWSLPRPEHSDPRFDMHGWRAPGGTY